MEHNVIPDACCKVNAWTTVLGRVLRLVPALAIKRASDEGVGSSRHGCPVFTIPEGL